MRSPTSQDGTVRQMVYLQLILGFALLVAGGEALVRGAVSVASQFGVSPLLIGLTLVGFGTSTPELVTSLQAAFGGFPGIAIGNVVGSNIAKVLLILGVAAVIMPLAIDPIAFRRDGTALAIATILAAGVIIYGALDRWMGSVLIFALLAYLVVAYQRDRSSTAAVRPQNVPEVAAVPCSVWIALGLAVGGIVVTILGARLTVDAAVTLALLWGMSETVVGLTVVAVGTSLPELVTSVMAALRRNPASLLETSLGRTSITSSASWVLPRLSGQSQSRHKLLNLMSGSCWRPPSRSPLQCWHGDTSGARPALCSWGPTLPTQHGWSHVCKQRFTLPPSLGVLLHTASGTNDTWTL
jgi:cation:H+ antiporter